ncbi:iron reductase [Amylocystis lapponica]|nr:iron reductase [Amylocystis lapponica]
MAETTAAAAASGTASALAATFDQSNFVFSVDIFLLSIVALFFLFALPAAVVRFSQQSEWTEGVFFRTVASGPRRSLSRSLSSSSKAALISTKPAYPPVVRFSQQSEWTQGVFFRTVVSSLRRSFSRSLSSSSKAAPISTEPAYPPVVVTLAFPTGDYVGKAVGMSDGSQITSSPKADSCSVKHLPQPQNKQPTHMLAWSSMLPLVHQYLAYPVCPGYSVGKALLLLAYAGVMLYAGLYNSSPFSNPVRAGYVAASQVPFLVILATKNNVIGWLVGCGYEKLNFLHRFVGRFVILAVNVHAIGCMFVITAEGSFWARLAASPNIAWGFVGLIAADILFLFSTSVVRQMCYPVFYVSHVFTALFILCALCAHQTWAVPYVVVAVAFYAFDRLLRVVRSCFVVASLHTLPELGMTRIEVPAVNAGWRAGQHVRIKVLSLGMGWLGWTETHPFTIASVSKGPDNEGLVLMCKKAGDWTGKLYELAKHTNNGEETAVGRSVRVVIDGPYGGPGHSVLASFSGAMFVAGGSGITYALGSVRDLMYRAAQGKTSVKVVELIWSVPDPASLAPLLPLFTSLLADSEHSSTRLRIAVFYTRAPSSPEAFAAVQALPPGLTLSAGRPKLGKILEGVVDHISSLDGGGRESVGPLTGVVAGVCGPLALGEELAKAVRGVSAARANAVGGIELHKECASFVSFGTHCAGC